MLNFNVDTSDLNNFKLKLDLEGILDEASAFLVSRILTRFMSEQSPDGKPWIPSKAGMSRRLQGGTGTLFDTGRLFRSIQVYKTDTNQRRIGTDVPYGAKHQLGLEGMIARPFLGFSKEDESMVKQIVQLRINEMIKS